jgi:hypothetical protein
MSFDTRWSERTFPKSMLVGDTIRLAPLPPPPPVTVKTKFCVALAPDALPQVNTRLNVPAVVGVPASVAPPLPLLTNATPPGNAPDSLTVPTGKPVQVTAKDPALPKANVVALALVKFGPSFTVSVKLCFAVATLFAALNVIVYTPPVAAAGVPLNAPVPATNDTPFGSVPLSLNVGAGYPVAVTPNDRALPAVNVAAFALVIAGPSFTAKVNPCAAPVPIPFEACNVKPYTPPLPTAGVPPSVPAPLPPSAKLTPPGNAPLSESAGGGAPIAVTAKFPAAPT